MAQMGSSPTTSTQTTDHTLQCPSGSLALQCIEPVALLNLIMRSVTKVQPLLPVRMQMHFIVALTTA